VTFEPLHYLLNFRVFLHYFLMQRSPSIACAVGPLAPAGGARR